MVKNRHWMFQVFLLFLFSISFSIPLAAGQGENVQGENADCIYYFYGEGCPDCQEVDAFLRMLGVRRPEIQLERFEIYYNSENLHLLKEYFDTYNVPEAQRDIPVVFMRGSYFIGEQSVKSLLEDRLADNDDPGCPSAEDRNVIGIVGRGSPANVLETLKFIPVTSSALFQGITTGALLILALLLFSTAIMDREELLRKGLLFAAGAYAAYFFFGVGIFGWFGRSSLSLLIFKILVLASIVFSLALLQDFIASLHAMFRTIPHRWWKTIQEKTMTLPVVLLLGFVIGLFTLPLAGGTLIAMRSVFAGGIARSAVFPLLLYYLIIMVLPLLLALGILALLRTHLEAKAATHDHKAEIWKRHYHKVLRFVIGIVVFIGGVILLFI